MQTVKADNQKRIRLWWARPGQVYVVERENAQRFALVLVAKPAKSEPFPRGSLRKYFTPRRDKLEQSLLKGCSLRVE